MKNLLLYLCVVLYSISAFAQNDQCGTHYMMTKQLEQDPSLIPVKDEFDREVHQTSLNVYDNTIVNKEEDQKIVIPVVVHIVYNDASQNISDAQVMSQIDALNRDYHHANPDSLPDSHDFYSIVGNPDIEFCLASYDDNLNPTSGITRNETTQFSYNIETNSENVKYKTYHGVDGWDQMKYLNFWVCNLELPVLGYARFPWSLASNHEADGIVVGYRWFGGIEAASSRPNARTCTHEVGHWLGLYHIWGDDTCGDDRIADTPPAIEKNFGCPHYPWRPNNRCGGDSKGEMFMNYMDYVDDDCMNSFTKGQVAVMHRTMNNERAEMMRSNRCEVNAGIRNFATQTKLYFKIVSTLTNGEYQINLNPDLYNNEISVSVVDMLGRTVYSSTTVPSEPIHFSIADGGAGMYFVHIRNKTFDATEKIMKL